MCWRKREPDSATWPASSPPRAYLSRHGATSTSGEALVRFVQRDRGLEIRADYRARPRSRPLSLLNRGAARRHRGSAGHALIVHLNGDAGARRSARSAVRATAPGACSIACLRRSASTLRDFPSSGSGSRCSRTSQRPRLCAGHKSASFRSRVQRDLKLSAMLGTGATEDLSRPLRAHQ